MDIFKIYFLLRVPPPSPSPSKKKKDYEEFVMFLQHFYLNLETLQNTPLQL